MEPKAGRRVEREQRELTWALMVILDSALEHSLSAETAFLMAQVMAGEEDEGLLGLEAGKDQRFADANEGGRRVGLYLEESDQRQTVGFTKAGALRARTYHLVIEDPRRLLKALQGLDEEQMRTDEQNPRRFELLTGVLRREIIQRFLLVKSEELDAADFFRFISDAELISSRLSELYPSKQLYTVESMLQFAKVQALGVYLKLEAAQCFDLPGERTFGPSQWHIDISEDGYRKKWEASIEAVTEGSTNPRAALLVLSAVENLLACLDHANTDMKQKLERPEVNATYRDLFPKLQSLMAGFLDRLKVLKTSLERPEDVS